MGLLDDLSSGLIPSQVGSQEFAESSDFCNKSLFPRQVVLLKLVFLEEMTGQEEDVLSDWIRSSEEGGEVKISPNIRERRDYLRERGYKHFREIQLVGGRRSSKGFCSGIILGKSMWDTVQLGDPHEYYGIDRGRIILFSCIAAAESQAKEFQYTDFVSTVENCKAFEPYFLKSLETEFRVATAADLRNIAAAKSKGGKIQRDIASLRGKALAANAGTLRGSATMAIALDEMAHMTVGESKASAEQVYNAAIPSINQFALDGLIMCNPPESPIWMSDLSFKPIGDVRIGDRVVGWQRLEGKKHRDLCDTEVLNVMKRTSPIVKVTLESGRSFRCTPDHRWLTTSYGGKHDVKRADGEYRCVCGANYLSQASMSAHLREAKKRGAEHSIEIAPKGYYQQSKEWFCTPEVGRKLCHVIDPTPELDDELIRDAAWLGGMFDGEGHTNRRQPLSISQSRTHNPLLCQEIERVLDRLGFEWTYHWNGLSGSYHILGDRQDKVNFANWTRPVRWRNIQRKVLSGRWRHEDKIVSVEPDGYGEVIALTTSTGNYICNGYASKNCNSSPYTKVGKFYEIFEVAMKPFDPHAVYTPGEALEERTDPRGFSIEFPSWELYKGYMKYKSKWKPRTRGRELGKMPTVSPDWDPDEVDAEGDALYSTDDQGLIVGQRLEEAKNPEAFKVEQRGQFAEVIDAFLNPAMVDRMYLGVPNGYDMQVDGTTQQRFTPIYTNFGQGALNQYRYKFHCDPSSTTAGFGFAIGHIEHFTDPVTGDSTEHVVMDMVKRWDPKVFGGVIRWKPILDEIAMYAEIFRPFEITMDQHQSMDPIQTLQETLNKRNITCQVYVKNATNESNWKGWQVLKTAIYQGLVHCPCDESNYNEPTCQNELKFLQELPTGGKFPKVEKQDIGPVRTKDQADCLREVVYTLIGNLMATRMRERLATGGSFGAPGGYGIGLGSSGPAGGSGPMGISEYYASREQKVMNGQVSRAAFAMDRSNLTRSALGARGHYRGGRSRGR